MISWWKNGFSMGYWYPYVGPSPGLGLALLFSFLSVPEHWNIYHLDILRLRFKHVFTFQKHTFYTKLEFKANFALNIVILYRLFISISL